MGSTGSILLRRGTASMGSLISLAHIPEAGGRRHCQDDLAAAFKPPLTMQGGEHSAGTSGS